MSRRDVQGPDVTFAAFLDRGEIQMQFCRDCGRQIFYPRTICPGCGGRDLAWRPIDPRGTVYSSTVIRRRPDRGGDYNLALIDLCEGARMMSRVEEVAPDAVQIGMPVSARIETSGDAPLVVFRPEDRS